VPSAGSGKKPHPDTFVKLPPKDVLFSAQANSAFVKEDDADEEIAHKREELYRDALEYQEQRLPLPQIVKTLNEGLDKAFVARKELVPALAKPKAFTYESVNGYLTKVKADKAAKELKKN
jgi:hypothetical protein